MQEVKDSFFIAIRDRLANSTGDDDASARIVACENDRCAWLAEADTFYLRWKGEAELPGDVQRAGWRTLHCEIGYRTQGTDVCSGEDRGRRLSALDQHLLQAATPRKAALLDCVQDRPAPLDGFILWTTPALKTHEDKLNGLQRVAQLDVLWREEEQA